MVKAATAPSVSVATGQEGETQTENVALQATAESQTEDQEAMQQRLLEQTDDAKVLDKLLGPDLLQYILKKDKRAIVFTFFT